MDIKTNNMTAVEWLVEQLNSKYNNDDFIITHINEIEQAKEMEKQQIIDAHLNGQAEFDTGPYRSEIIKHSEQYYNETFNK